MRWKCQENANTMAISSIMTAYAYTIYNIQYNTIPSIAALNIRKNIYIYIFIYKKNHCNRRSEKNRKKSTTYIYYILPFMVRETLPFQRNKTKKRDKKKSYRNIMDGHFTCSVWHPVSHWLMIIECKLFQRRNRKCKNDWATCQFSIIFCTNF